MGVLRRQLSRRKWLVALVTLSALWVTFRPESMSAFFGANTRLHVCLEREIVQVDSKPAAPSAKSNMILVKTNDSSFWAGHRWHGEPVLDSQPHDAKPSAQQSSNQSAGTNHVICVIAPGRLGNLMFTYASSLGVARKLGMSIVIERKNEIRSAFNVTAPVVEKLPCTKNVYVNQCCRFYPEAFRYNASENFNFGLYLQSWKFFDHVRAEVLREFTFLDDIERAARERITAAVRQSNHVCGADRPCTLIGLHVRHGDLVSVPKFIKYGYVAAPKEYIEAAMARIREEESYPLFLVATDNLPWVKSIVRGKDVVHMEGNSPTVDLAILSLCTRVIITTGTFGWWAAYLAGGQAIYFRYGSRPGSAFYNETVDSLNDFFPRHWISL